MQSWIGNNSKYTKIPYWIIILAIIGGLFTFLCLSGIVSISWHGFGVDYDGNCYIGKDSSIDVYKNNQKICSIQILYKSYAFTIKDGTQILIATEDSLTTMDLEGNIIDEIIAENDVDKISEYRRITNKYRKLTDFCSEHGEIYHLSKRFGRYTVSNQYGNILWQMPLLDYFVKWLWTPMGVFIFLGLFRILTNSARERWSEYKKQHGILT